MEKINKFILKNPFLAALISFIFALIITYIIKVILGFKSITLDNCIYILTLSTALSYGHYFKEVMPKTYRLTYSLINTFLYLLLDILIILFSKEIANSQFKNIIYFSMLIPLIFMPFIIFHALGYLSKISAKYDFKKQALIEKNMPIEIQKERKTASLLYFLFISIGLVIFALNDRKILHFSDNVLIILSLSFLGMMIFLAKYFKKTYNINLTKLDNDEKSDVE